MLFDLKPKDAPRELFGREEELDRLVEMLRAGNWVVVIGPRMVGKTSLIKAANSKVRLSNSVCQPMGSKRGIQGLLGSLVNAINSSSSSDWEIQGLCGKDRRSVYRPWWHFSNFAEEASHGCMGLA